MQNTITLNELLPKHIKKITTGSELLLAYEIGKYTRIMLNRELELGVSIDKDLLSGDHFSFVYQNGLNVGFMPERENLADISKVSRFFFKGTVEGVALKLDTDELVVYNFDEDPRANAVLHFGNRSTAYISLLAFILVRAFANGKQIPKIVIDHKLYINTELEYSELFVLKNWGNRLFEDILTIEYSDERGYQPEWEAFVEYNRQRGVMNREYSASEKYKYLKKHFEVGDVVLLYHRTKPSVGKTINILKSCYPAVITAFDQKTVKLTYFPIVQTRFTRISEISSVEQELWDEGRDSLFTESDFERFDTPTMTMNLTEIGVDTHTWVERDFFIKPMDFDGSYQYFKTPEGSTHIHLSTLDVIYAVFEDRKVEYNREKFLNEYFTSVNRKPVYDKMMEALQVHNQ